MIRLDIAQFGGRGGSSGGVGRSSSETSGAGGDPARYGTDHAESQRKENNEQQTEGKTRQTSVVAGRIVRESDISSKDSYTLYRVVDTKDGKQKEVEYKTKTGAELRNDIAYDKLELNRKEKVWTSKKGYKYAIRKKQ